jgi:hypothetical protein
LRPTRSFSTRLRLLVAAAGAAALLPSAAAAEISSRYAGRTGGQAVSEWAYFDPARGTTSYNTDLKRIVGLSRSWRREGGELLWFRNGGRDYVVRDAEILGRARAILKDQRELDPEIEAVERRTKSIETREERLEREEERLEREMDRIDNERDAIHDRRSRSERDRQRLSQLRSAADTIRQRMAELNVRREAIDRDLAEVSREEQALDQRHSRLEARADAAMARLCLDVLAAGRARPFTR